MKSLNYCISMVSRKAPEFIDITDQVHKYVVQSKIKNGCVLIFSKHTTASIKINENEPLLLKDMEQFLEHIAPRNGHYQHNDFTVRTVNMTDNERPNGHAHLQSLLLGSSETIPLINGVLQLGKWQRIFLIELDMPRPREVLVQVIGEY